MAPSKFNQIPHSFPQTQEEKHALEQLRQAFLPESEKWDDFYMLRWLRARDLNVSKAKEMLERNLTWRTNNAQMLDNIQSYRPPQEFKQKCPFKFTGTDDIGRPIIFEKLGRWEMRYLIEHGYREEVFPFLYQILEEIIFRINKARAMNPDVTQLVVVMDMEELTWWKIGSVEIVQFCLKFFREFEAYYPEILHSVYVINAHWIFQYVFTMVKPILSAKTLGKVKVYSKDRSAWEPVLKANIPPDAIPLEYGGTENPVIKS